MRTDVKPTKALGPRQLEACSALTFGNIGSMRYRLRTYRGRGQDHAVRIFVNRKLVAWALVFTNNGDFDTKTAYFFTDPQHRRKGYGTMLRNIITKRWGPNVTVMPHDEPSKAFFAATEPK